MTFPEVVLRRGKDRLVSGGHPWVYSGAIERRSTDAGPGDIVDVVSVKGRFIGRGYFNPLSSTITVRILTRDRTCPIDRQFFTAAIRRARQLRRHPSLSNTEAYRLVHGESDGLPGLVVDDYAGFLVVQFHTVGMDRCRSLVVDALNETVEPRGIYERSDVGTRRADGLEDRPTGHLSGADPPDPIEFRENGVRLRVDIRRGQKTGFFLDQRDNRLSVQQLARQMTVLDCFAYTGGFAAHALVGGARRVVAVDVVPQVARFGLPSNLRANASPSSDCDYVVADAFAFLHEAANRGPRFDMVILDPPSLLRKSRDIGRATGVYIKLNRNALKLVRDGGIFVTASCSTRVSAEDFLQIVRKAAVGAGVELRVFTFNLQPPDHPVDPAFPEGRYLKCVFAAVRRPT